MTIYDNSETGVFRCYTHSFSSDTIEEFDWHCSQVEHNHSYEMNLANGQTVIVEYYGKTDGQSTRYIDTSKVKIEVIRDS